MKKRNIRKALLLALLLLVSCLFFYACSNKKEEVKEDAEKEAGTTVEDKGGEDKAKGDKAEDNKAEAGKTEDKKAEDNNAKDDEAKEDEAKEKEPEGDGTVENLLSASIMPKFEDAVIYDRDGIKLSALFEGVDEKPNKTWFHALKLKFENHREEALGIYVDYIELKDGFVLKTGNYGNVLDPDSDVTENVLFLNDALCYRIFGLGDQLPEFRLHCSTFDETEEVKTGEFKTEFIKTGAQNSAPDYSKLDNKQLLLDEGGIKLYFLDALLLASPSEKEPDKKLYMVSFYYENQNDKNYILRYGDISFNGKPYEYPISDEMLFAKTRGIEQLTMNSSSMEKVLGAPIESFAFNARILDYGEDYLYNFDFENEEEGYGREVFKKTGIKLDFPKKLRLIQ